MVQAAQFHCSTPNYVPQLKVKFCHGQSLRLFLVEQQQSAINFNIFHLFFMSTLLLTNSIFCTRRILCIGMFCTFFHSSRGFLLTITVTCSSRNLFYQQTEPPACGGHCSRESAGIANWMGPRCTKVVLAVVIVWMRCDSLLLFNLLVVQILGKELFPIVI
jgi:hypothetical protein